MVLRVQCVCAAILATLAWANETRHVSDTSDLFQVAARVRQDDDNQKPMWPTLEASLENLGHLKNAWNEELDRRIAALDKERRRLQDLKLKDEQAENRIRDLREAAAAGGERRRSPQAENETMTAERSALKAQKQRGTADGEAKKAEVAANVTERAAQKQREDAENEANKAHDRAVTAAQRKKLQARFKEEGRILLRFVHEGGIHKKQVNIPVKPSNILQGSMDWVIQRLDLDPVMTRFQLPDEKLAGGKDTALSLGLKDNDIILVKTPQRPSS